MHIEYGPAQIEIIVEYGEAIEVADKTVLLKNIVKEVARKHGLYDGNLYLVIASSLAGGLYGIENGLNLSEAASSNAYSTVKNPLPRNLEQDLNRLEKSGSAKKYFSEEFVNLFLSIGRNEVNLYDAAVTDWEFNRYFEYS
ncbi:glutamine synthetase [Clostridium estertheticum]|nr:glutamine synthetase [Clostridium estertheticum]